MTLSVGEQRTVDGLKAGLERISSEFAEIVTYLPPEDYANPSFEIGAHMRHALECAEALVNGAASGEVCYDDRQRNTLYERDGNAALAAFQEAIGEIGAVLAEQGPHMSLLKREAVHAEFPDVTTRTTLGSEVIYVISHTTHHFGSAVILSDARAFRALPEHIGLAPATVWHRKK